MARAIYKKYPDWIIGEMPAELVNAYVEVNDREPVYSPDDEVLEVGYEKSL